ncbi:MAG: ACP S-malonyltransferase [Propioniciclava sp.]
MLAIVAPGQGAQTPGFLTPWLTDGAVRNHVADLTAAAGVDLIHAGTVADADTIRDTAVAQPLLVAAGLIAASALVTDIGPADVLAGHSVGEVTAAGIAGVLAPLDAIRLVRERALGMAEAAATTPTTMAAVVRGEPDQVLAAITAVGATAANHNGAGQIVAAGTTAQISALREKPPTGARVIPLSVAGAFHTEHMQPGKERLAALAVHLTPADPQSTLLSNADGAVVESGTGYLERLVGQVTQPVRWDLCMTTMADLGVTGILELPPAGTLTGIAKRNLPGVELFNLNTPDQLDEARAFVARHRAQEA